METREEPPATSLETGPKPQCAEDPTSRISWLGVAPVIALCVYLCIHPVVGVRVLRFIVATAIATTLYSGIHYLSGRLRGITVEQVSLFFGGSIARWKCGNTWFSVGWFPLGSFVKFKGTGFPRSPENSNDQTSWESVSRMLRALIVLSAPVGVLGFGIFLTGFEYSREFVARWPHWLYEYTFHTRIAFNALVEFLDRSDTLQRIGAVSIWMALFNLLPVPVCSGGQALSELLGFRERMLSFLQLSGLLLFLAWFLYVVYNFCIG